MKLNLSNPEFCTYLLSQFPFAADHEKEMMLSDYLMEHFKMPSNEWLEELSGQTDENGRELDPWNGYTYVHKVNDQLTLFAEFHPYNTVYFFNDIYLGNTGGNAHLSLLSWTELKTIVANDTTVQSPLFFLLLPLAIGNESERTEIESKILADLQQTALDIDQEQLRHMTKVLTNHLIFKDNRENILLSKEHVGLTTNRNHSERNQEHNEDALKQINDIISLAVA